MGKGKGMLERSVLRIKKNFILFEFKGYTRCKLKKFCFYINKRLKLNFYLFYKNTYTYKYNLWCYKNHYINYFDKYGVY
jgi:hypothetical protein